MNAPWYTHGNRLVIQVAPDEPVPLEEQAFFYWDRHVPGSDIDELNREM
jgi:hypothetical protein